MTFRDMAFREEEESTSKPQSSSGYKEEKSQGILQPTPPEKPVETPKL